MTGYLQVFEVDEQDNGRVLGGAGFTTMRETRRRFAAIPPVPEPSAGQPDYVLDLMDRRGDIIEDKHISQDVALDLLGVTLDEARAAADAHLAEVIAAHRESPL